MNSEQSFPTIAKAAREYAARGWHVFPVPIGKKLSHKSAEHSGGRKWGATTEPAEIARDWQQWPDANVGIVTGPKSGLLVIEADTDAGHAVDGIGNLEALIDQNGPLPHTIEALSPSGSWHLYFKWPDDLDIRNSAGQVAPGVDVRGNGGMVVSVPSVKPGHALPYRWKNPPGLFDLADCPEWLVRRCIKVSKQVRQIGLSIDTGGKSWADTALRNEIADLLAAPVTKRNDTLNDAAFNLAQIVAGGGLPEGMVRDRFSAAASCIGLEPGEIAATIQSAFQAGLQTPRGPKPRGADAQATDWGDMTDDSAGDAGHGSNAPNDIDLSQDALASDLGARDWDANARHVAGWGKWLFWTGTRWQADEKLEHLTRVRSYLRNRAEELTDWAEAKAPALEAEKPGEGDKLCNWAKGQARNLRSKNTVAAVESLARSNAASVAGADAFDADRLLLGTPGGTVDLRTGELRQAKRGDLITKLTACAPAEPGARPERWLSFLNEVFDHDPDLVTFIQRGIGYALTGLTTEHKLLFLYGTGRNGKSVLLNTVSHIWGDYSRKAAAETFLNTQADKHSTGLAGLQGARLVIGSELPVGKTWDESVIKDLTGGDKMTARFMRGDFFDFDPQLTLMIAGNNQPSFRGVDEAIRARVVLVPFLVTIPPERRDKGLPDKLKAEGPQILRWAIDGALQWQERGLDVPAKVAAASTEYMDDEDTLGQFLKDEARIVAGHFVTAQDLHLRFTQWSEAQGLKPWTQRTLVKEIKSRGFEAAKSNGQRGLRGLGLT